MIATIKPRKKEAKMAIKDIIVMSKTELKRLYLVKKAIAGEVSQVEIAEALDLSERQIRRIVKRVKEKGDEGVVHGLRGVESNRRYDEVFKGKVIGIYKKKYGDFGPTFASEKLDGLEETKLSKETLRKWLMSDKEIECVWQRKGRKHRRWRERKAHRGEMLQMDGSVHDWLEGRGLKCVLMAYIDDADNEVHARFYGYEGTKPAMDSFRRYIRKYGIPNSLYADGHTTYRSPDKLTIEEELAGKAKSQTQFERAVGELGVKIIPAYSPQAKGRIERQFRTFQDRLVKELRLHGINSIEEANEFLKTYLPIYNKKFGVIPREKADLHRRVPKGINLDRIFCIKTPHVLRNDTTVVHETKLYQVKDKTKAKKVTVEEQINGTIKIYAGKDRSLRYQEITRIPEKKEKKIRKPEIKLASLPKKKYIPSADHPWRSFKFGRSSKAVNGQAVKPLAGQF